MQHTTNTRSTSPVAGLVLNIMDQSAAQIEAILTDTYRNNDKAGLNVAATTLAHLSDLRTTISSKAEIVSASSSPTTEAPKRTNTRRAVRGKGKGVRGRTKAAVSESTSTMEAVAAPVKRGRGRPPKMAVTAAAQVATEVVAEKRGRGRPRKDASLATATAKPTRSRKNLSGNTMTKPRMRELLITALTNLKGEMATWNAIENRVAKLADNEFTPLDLQHITNTTRPRWKYQLSSMKVQLTKEGLLHAESGDGDAVFGLVAEKSQRQTTPA